MKDWFYIDSPTSEKRSSTRHTYGLCRACSKHVVCETCKQTGEVTHVDNKEQDSYLYCSRCDVQCDLSLSDFTK